MVVQLLGIENTKLTRRTMLWVELALIAVAVVALVLLMYAIYAAPKPAELQDVKGAGAADAMIAQFIMWPGALLNSLSLAGSGAFGGLLLIVLVGSVAAQEYGWRTLHVLLGRGVSRTALLTAKFLALLVPVALIVLTPLIVGAPITALFTVIIRGSLDVSQVDFGQLGLAALRTMYTLLPYGALTFMLAVVTRSTVAAIGGGLGYALLIEGLLIQILSMFGGVFSKIWTYLPAGLSQSVLSLNQVARSTGVTVNGQSAALTTLDPTAAAIGIALYVIVFFGIALWAFRRQDLTA